MTERISLQAAIATFVADSRREHGLTLDQVARSAREYGASWSASSVSNIERGQASLTLSTLIVLALALGDLLERPLTLADLLGDVQEVILVQGSGQVVTRSWMNSVLAGAKVAMDAPTRNRSDDSSEFDEEFEEEVLKRMRETRGKQVALADKHAHVDQLLEQSQMPPERSLRAHSSNRATSLAEARAANKLGMDTSRLRQLALELWGRSIDDEASFRAGAKNSPQARGRITRVLMDEIRTADERRR